jgi:hypothetical protein
MKQHETDHGDEDYRDFAAISFTPLHVIIALLVGIGTALYFIYG